MPRHQLASIIACAGVLIAVGGATQRVSAGIANSPLPMFSDGKQSVQVLAVPGVLKRDRLQTDFLCTSLDSVAVDVGVEVFGTDGTLQNDVHAGNGAVLNVGPGQTVTLGTNGTVAYSETAIIALAAVSQGSARVVASSDRVRCNVIILDDTLSPPVTVATLGEGFRPVAGPILPTLPLPQFSDAQPAAYAVLVPGIVKRNPMDTSFFCTSLAPGNIDIGVQIISTSGTVLNNIAAGNGAVLNVAPGATVTLSTTGTAAFFETSVIVTTGVAQGLARIVSTSGQVTCNAVVLDATVTPPTAMSGLVGAP